MKGRVLHVIYSMKQGGAERLLLDDVIAQERAARDGTGSSFPGIVVCWNFQGTLTDQLEENSVPYRVLNRKLRPIWKLPLFVSDMFGLVSEIRRLAAEYESPIIHGHLVDSILLAALAARSPNVKSVGTVYSNHVIPMSIPEGSVKRWVWTRLTRWSMGKVDRVISISPEVTKSIVDGYGVPATRIAERLVMVEPVEMPVSREDARKALNVPDDALCLAFIGRLVENKNQQCLIRMAASLKQSGVRVRLLLVGDGPDMDDLLSLRDDLGAGDCVNLLGHFKDLPLVLSATDMIVTASKSEGVSLALLEAMSANKPIISTNNEGNRELLKDGIGTLVEHSDPDTIATAVSELWSNTPRRNAQVKAARAFYDAYREKANVTQGSNSVYASVLPGDGAS